MHESVPPSRTLTRGPRGTAVLISFAPQGHSPTEALSSEFESATSGEASANLQNLPQTSADRTVSAVVLNAKLFAMPKQALIRLAMRRNKITQMNRPRPPLHNTVYRRVGGVMRFLLRRLNSA